MILSCIKPAEYYAFRHHNTEADTGYQGLQKKHDNSEIPKKRSKKKTLTAEDKKQNREISSNRADREHYP